MEEHQEELATIEAIDSGAVYTLALKTHVGMSIQTFRYFAGWCDKIQVNLVTPTACKSALIIIVKKDKGIKVVDGYFEINGGDLFTGKHHPHQPGQAQS